MDKADEIRALVAGKIMEKGLEMKEISTRYLNKSHSYIHQYINKKTPRQLAYEDRVILAPLLGLNETDLRVDIPGFAEKSVSFMQTSAGDNKKYIRPDLVSDATLLAAKLGADEKEIKQIALEAAEIASNYNHKITEELIKHLLKMRQS